MSKRNVVIAKNANEAKKTKVGFEDIYDAVQALKAMGSPKNMHIWNVQAGEPRNTGIRY